jgi:diguanylate cyclase (GGDEF)-like protein
MKKIKQYHTLPEKMIKLLIAEDDLVSMKILEKHAKTWGFDVYTANNGKKAWNTFQKENTQIAILDWMMPRMSGIELCEHIRQKTSEEYAYIILLTSRKNQNDVITGLIAGADDYITKPFNIPELKVRLKIGSRIIKLQQQLLESKRKIQEIAIHDGLTTLLNRAEIVRILSEAFEQARREKKPLGAIMLDIDHFKKINDNFGHQTGDSVLTKIAIRLKENIRPYDKIGRYGGDEFLVVLPNCGLIEVAQIAERLRVSICKKKIKTENQLLNISTSLGCTSLENPNISSPKELMNISDHALYEAKKEGRNQVVIA